MDRGLRIVKDVISLGQLLRLACHIAAPRAKDSAHEGLLLLPCFLASPNRRWNWIRNPSRLVPAFSCNAQSKNTRCSTIAVSNRRFCCAACCVALEKEMLLRCLRMTSCTMPHSHSMPALSAGPSIFKTHIAAFDWAAPCAAWPPWHHAAAATSGWCLLMWAALPACQLATLHLELVFASSPRCGRCCYRGRTWPWAPRGGTPSNAAY